MRLIDADILEQTIDNFCDAGGIWEKPFREYMLAFIKLVGRQETVKAMPTDFVLDIIRSEKRFTSQAPAIYALERVEKRVLDFESVDGVKTE